MILVLVVILVTALLVSPAVPYARGWGYTPVGIVGILLLVFVLLWITGLLGTPVRHW